MKYMKALFYLSPRKLAIREIPLPLIQDKEVLIKIKAVGICGSDFEGYLGKTGRRIPPMIMGHEMAGVVEETGKSEKFIPGDRVVVQPILNCGQCIYCKEGKINLCKNWKSLGVLDINGGMEEYIVVPEDNIFKINEKIRYKEASMVEPLAVAYRAVKQIPLEKLNQSKFILIIGAGTIGLLLLQILKQKTKSKIVVSDIKPYRLRLAQELGADQLINPTQDVLQSRIDEVTNKEGVDISLEAVGISSSAAQSVEVLKDGGMAIWVGNVQKMVQVNMQRIVTGEITIQGNRAYNIDDFKNALDLVNKRKLNLNRLISKVAKLEQGSAMFRQLENNDDGKLIKVILTP